MTERRDPHAAFSREVLRQCSFLEEMGFRRAEQYESHGSVGSSVVFMGHHVGFSFSLDVRENSIGVEVFRVVEGKKLSEWEGGYSADLWEHLVKHVGYRGRVGPAEASGLRAPSLTSTVAAWVGLLKSVGGPLLSDTQDSLPRGPVP